MNPADHVPKDAALKVLYEQYCSNQTMTKAQLDCLVQHGVLNERNGTYWAGPHAASLSGGK